MIDTSSQVIDRFYRVIDISDTAIVLHRMKTKLQILRVVYKTFF